MGVHITAYLPIYLLNRITKPIRFLKYPNGYKDVNQSVTTCTLSWL